jgi:hypothetical protein
MPSFLLLSHANNTLSIIFTRKTTGVFPFFPPKQCMISHVHKVFLGIQILVQNRNHIGVCSNKQVLEIQVIP